MQRTTVLATVIAVAAITIGGFQHFRSVHTQAEPFDTYQWRALQREAQQNDPGCVRGGMALTLIQSKSLNNRSRTEVIEQLGEADTTRASELHYNLGQCHWDWQHSALVVTLNRDGLVSDTAIEKE